jgi:hypothetical protein
MAADESYRGLKRCGFGRSWARALRLRPNGPATSKHISWVSTWVEAAPHLRNEPAHERSRLVGAENPITADEQGKRDSLKELTPRPEAPGESVCSPGRRGRLPPNTWGSCLPWELPRHLRDARSRTARHLVSGLQVDGCFARKARLSLKGCAGGTFRMAWGGIISS